MASISKRTLKTGKFHYRAQVRLQGFPPVVKTFDSKAEAKEWAAITEADMRRGLYFPGQTDTKRTFSALLESYQLIHPLDRHQRCRLSWWSRHLSKQALGTITSQTIVALRQKLLSEKTPKGNLRTPSIANRFVANLSSLLNYATKDLGWMRENPCHRISSLKEGAGRDRVLTKEEAERLLAACKQSLHPYLYCIVAVALSTGARQGEILSLQWSDVDLAKGRIDLKKTKNGKMRSLPLVGTAFHLLQALHAKSESKQVFPPLKFGAARVCIRAAWQSALQASKVFNFRFHDLRHCFATWASSTGASNLQLAAATGHSSLSMLQRYTHLDADNTRHLSEHINREFLGVTS